MRQRSHQANYVPQGRTRQVEEEPVMSVRPRKSANYDDYSDEESEVGGKGTVVPKRIAKKSVGQERVRAAPMGKKPARNGGGGKKSEEVGKIAQFIDFNSIPDELPASPTRGGQGNYIAPVPRSYAPGPQAASRMAPPAKVSPLKTYNGGGDGRPLQMMPMHQQHQQHQQQPGRAPGQPIMQRIVPPLPMMRPMQLSRGDDDGRRGGQGDDAYRQDDHGHGQGERHSARQDSYRAEDRYDENENDFDDFEDADDDDLGGVSSVAEGPRSSRSNRGPHGQGASPKTSARSYRSDRSDRSDDYRQDRAAESPPAAWQPARLKGREQTPKSFNDDGARRDDGGGRGGGGRDVHDDDDFWDDDDKDDYNDKYGDYESPPLSARSYSDSPRQQRGHGGGGGGGKSKFAAAPQPKPARKPAATSGRARAPSAAQPPAPTQDPARRHAPTRQRSPVARGNSTYAPPPLPHESSNTVSDRRMGDPKKEVPERDMLYYSRAPRDVAYKPCSVTEYKQNHKPGRYVEIESLKPDLNSEELQAKRANADRVKEFSKHLKSYNMSAIRAQKKTAPSTSIGKPSGKPSSGSEVQRTTTKSHDAAKSEAMSKRDRMKEFSKKVSKPLPKPQKKQGGGFDHAYMTAKDEFGMDHVEAVRLQELEAKHEESEAQLNAIKRSLGMR